MAMQEKVGQDIHLKDPTSFPHQKQYPLKPGAKKVYK